MSKKTPTTRIGERSAKTGRFVKDGTAEKRPAIRRNPPEFLVSDDLSWLTESAELVAGFDGDLFIEFENRFPARIH